MISIKLDSRSLLSIRERMAILAMPPKQRYQLMNRIGREVAKASRTRIRKLQSPDGSAWKPIKSKRKPVRIKGMAKLLQSKANAESATLSFKGQLAGTIAAQLHQGVTQQRTAPPQKAPKPRASEKGKPKRPFQPTDEPCTRSQAVRLRALGYTVLVSGGKGKAKRYRKPSLKWMQAHISSTRAAILIRTSTGETRKNRWTVTTPARPLLPKANNAALMTIAAREFKKMGWGGSK
ncbi:phage virion morphogenesis protein [Aeromonas hydrophila]|uniref:phage virion morphogenesis protein n=1 Tax=Aeromonas hydrophila TaxID=644 RepID=UPI003D1CF9C8